MKKIIMVFFILLSVFSIKNVFAQDQYKLTLLKQDGIYFSRRGGVVTDSNPYYIYKLDDIYAYCLEPGKKITTYTYMGNEEFVDLSFSEELKEKLELIGYYGRDYSGHDNVRYSMATQALIWELTGVNSVTFWTGKNETGSEIDVTKEKEEIMNLVNNHKTLPSFSSSLNTYVKHNEEFIDTNKVLDNFEIVESDIENVSINDNKLHINSNKKGVYHLKLQRKNYNEYKTIIFVGKDKTSSQKLARLHFSREISMDLTINVKGVKLLIHKVDENNNPVLKENIIFKIKNLNTGEYLCENNDCTFLTNKDGIVLTNELEYGEYEIEEDENQIVEGYTWNPNKLRILINYDSDIKWNNDYKSYLELTFSNQEILGNIKIQKLGEELKIIDNEITYEKKSLENISFSLYDDKDNLIDTLVTDSNGLCSYNNLKIGKYYVMENTKLSDYIDNNDKHSFEIKQNNQYDKVINVNLTIDNYLKKGTLEFTKKDLETEIGISNTTMEIYDENNNLLLTKETDDNGTIVINNLPIGKYYLKEKEANDEYLISNEIISFEIKENSEIVKKEMTNERITGTLNIIKKGEDYLYQDSEIIYNKINLEGIKFNLYDNNDKLISNLVTDHNGKAMINKLPLGKYYLKEENNDDKYILNDNKYYFEIEKNNQSISLEIDNYLKKGTLEFTKEDLVTSEGIENTIIEIYDENDNLIFTKETDEKGKVIISNLPIGKYYIIEKEANTNYQITNEHVYFEIKENGEIVKAKMTNEKIVVPVPKTGKNSMVLSSFLFGIFFIISIGNIYYEKSKSN